MVPTLVTSEDNSNLTIMLSFEEICVVIFDMDPLSASGLDGFTSRFLEVVGKLLV